MGERGEAKKERAKVAELADALALGASADEACGFESRPSHKLGRDVLPGIIVLASGNSSGVERHLAEVEAAGSNPVSRSSRRGGGSGRRRGLKIPRANPLLVRVRVPPPAGAGWSSQEARRAHNPEVVGSNPTPATRRSSSIGESARPITARFRVRSPAPPQGM